MAAKTSYFNRLEESLILILTIVTPAFAMPRKERTRILTHPSFCAILFQARNSNVFTVLTFALSSSIITLNT